MNPCPLPGNPVEQYLIHSYVYYELYDNIISDAQFDALCRWMADNYDSLNHPHKHIVSLDALNAGTGHHLVYRFPADIKAAAHELLEG